MKRWILILLICFPVLIAAKCMPDQQFVKGVEGYTDVILPEYERYINADSRLNEDDKAIRLESSTGLKALIEEAKDE